ncbi:MAG: Gfo/Idh/MocA family oxidoreductase [Clostridiales bacterium]|jgi:predicted dehydrogenase|nr:Gfo/Idh/MocA family oxidoreductase [Clostridiales bacterium]
MKKPTVINLAVVGYGGMAGHHASRLKGHPLYTIAGVYDIDPARGDAARGDGLRVYGSYAEIGADKGVDAVLIATPNDLHPFYAEYFAARGKHILCEKPAANTSADFETMVAAAEKNNTVLMVHQNRRWDKDFVTVRKVAESGVIGAPMRVESRVTGGNGIPGGWRKLQKHGGGMMPDWGVHLIDQLCHMVSAPIVRLHCDYSYRQGHECEDGFELELAFEGGPSARVTVTTDSYLPQPRWFIYGQKGSATVADWDCRGKIAVKKEYDGEIKGIAAGNGFTKTMADLPDAAVAVYDLPDVPTDYNRFYDNFAAACAGREPPEIKNAEILRVLKIMEAARASHEKRIVITDKL